MMSEYEVFERRHGDSKVRKCINGRNTGCGNCVGFCKFSGHPGYLTRDLRREHDCINKKCHYYIQKPIRAPLSKPKDIASGLLTIVKKQLVDFDDLRVVNIHQIGDKWIIEYISVFGQYDLFDIEQTIKADVGVSVEIRKLDYSFERCVELMCGRC